MHEPHSQKKIAKYTFPIKDSPWTFVIQCHNLYSLWEVCLENGNQYRFLGLLALHRVIDLILILQNRYEEVPDSFGFLSRDLDTEELILRAGTVFDKANYRISLEAEDQLGKDLTKLQILHALGILT